MAATVDIYTGDFSSGRSYDQSDRGARLLFSNSRYGFHVGGTRRRRPNYVQPHLISEHAFVPGDHPAFHSGYWTGDFIDPACGEEAISFPHPHFEQQDRTNLRYVTFAAMAYFGGDVTGILPEKVVLAAEFSGKLASHRVAFGRSATTGRFHKEAKW